MLPRRAESLQVVSPDLLVRVEKGASSQAESTFPLSLRLSGWQSVDARWSVNSTELPTWLAGLRGAAGVVVPGEEAGAARRPAGGGAVLKVLKAELERLARRQRGQGSPSDILVMLYFKLPVLCNFPGLRWLSGTLPPASFGRHALNPA